jgi:hypothetical protein
VPPKSISAVIPSNEVLKRIQAHYIESVAQAEDEYVHKDEEFLTEALGAAYVSLDETIEGVDYACHLVADYRKLHKHQKGAADIGRHRGIFQIELMDDARSVQYRFGLLFHAKVQWSGRDAHLLAQARRLNGNFRRAIVMDYSAEGYTAASAVHVIAADGDRRRMRTRVRKLSQMLAIEFVHGRMGNLYLNLDANKEGLHDPLEQADPLAIEHVFSIRCRKKF